MTHPHLIPCLLLFSMTCLSAAPDLPKDIKALYQSAPDQKVSDDFNAPIDFKKWTYREPRDDGKKRVEAGPTFAYTTEGYLSLSAKESTMGGGGLSGLNVAHFGFYMTRWRFVGLSEEAQNRSAFHPSIWAANSNLGVKKAKTPTGGDWIEIDLIEYENTTPASWSADTPVRIKGQIQNNRNNTKKPILLKPGIRKDFAEWKTLGFEYHRDYLQLWEFDQESWKKIGERITITDGGASTETSFPRTCAKPVYWVFSNIAVSYQKNNPPADTSLQVDYFHYYPLK